MTDQISTPGSNAESSVNVGKVGAPKDKSCPFCQQPFTSSSLGRHLDLYIREKNPKPSDGVHNVDEIRKMRGGITRRQPRNSMSRREGSTPGGTPGVNGDGNGKRSPQPEAGLRVGRNSDLRSPTIRRPPIDLNVEPGKGLIHTSWHKASWEATGVINDIPPITPNGDSEKWAREGNDRRAGRRTVDVRRAVSRQMIAKNAFDQKQKMAEALDQARAAELALREILGSIRAANRRVKPSASPFDYDPLSLDFPALTLHCLPPPPTLFQVSPVPSAGSWSVNPPGDTQREALRSHFCDAFHAWRITRAVTSSAHPDEILFYRSDLSRSSDEEEINTAAQDLEDRVLNHLDAAFMQWSSLSSSIKDQVWRLELARSVGRKALIISSMKSDREKILQDNAHLRTQVEQLSRCQQPREFQMMPPTTIPISSRAAVELDDMGVRGVAVGLSIDDKDEPIEGLVKNAVGRWLAVIRSSRGNAGMASQRSLDQHVGKNERQQTMSQIQNENGSSAIRNADGERDSEMDLDADADADADADEEGEESYDIPTSIPIQGRVPEAPMGMMSTGYRNHDGTNGETNMDREGINAQFCGGRIRL